MKNTSLNVTQARADLLAAIILHVPFDGWSDPAFATAVADCAMDPALARVICPRGAVDLAVDYHRAGDRAMAERLAETDLAAMRYRDRVATAVRFRLEAVDPELVRRGAAVFALPAHAATGASLVWGTADAIWQALGDTSADYNWYTKRATLAGVYSATVLYWLGDVSAGYADTWAFLDRRIEGILGFEKVKSRALKIPGVRRLLDGVRAPDATTDMPGRVMR
ncbi:COQ9 family protein [Candidatus Falkowbacteria bacterium]|nr:COQ9 family protein [Candidatus Falkowbacteria bacterium]